MRVTTMRLAMAGFLIVSAVGCQSGRMSWPFASKKTPPAAPYASTQPGGAQLPSSTATPSYVGQQPAGGYVATNPYAAQPAGATGGAGGYGATPASYSSTAPGYGGATSPNPYASNPTGGYGATAQPYPTSTAAGSMQAQSGPYGTTYPSSQPGNGAASPAGYGAPNSTGYGQPASGYTTANTQPARYVDSAGANSGYASPASTSSYPEPVRTASNDRYGPAASSGYTTGSQYDPKPATAATMQPVGYSTPTSATGTSSAAWQPGNTGYNPGASNYQPGNTGYTPPSTPSYPSPATPYSTGASTTPAAAPYRPGGTRDYNPSSSTAPAATPASPTTPAGSSVQPANYETPRYTTGATTPTDNRYGAPATTSPGISVPVYGQQ